MIPDVMEYRIHPYPFFCWYDPIFFAPNEHGIVPSIDVGVSGGRIGNPVFAYSVPPSPIHQLGYVGSTPAEGIGRIFENPAVAQSAVYCNVGPWHHNPGGAETYRVLVFSEVPESVTEGDEFQFELKPKRMPQNDYTHCEKTGSPELRCEKTGVGREDVSFSLVNSPIFSSSMQMSANGTARIYYSGFEQLPQSDTYVRLFARFYSVGDGYDSTSDPIRVVPRDMLLRCEVNQHVVEGQNILLTHRLKNSSNADTNAPVDLSVVSRLDPVASGAVPALFSKVGGQPITPSSTFNTAIVSGSSYRNDVVAFDAAWPTGVTETVNELTSMTTPLKRKARRQITLSRKGGEAQAFLIVSEWPSPGTYSLWGSIFLKNAVTQRTTEDAVYGWLPFIRHTWVVHSEEDWDILEEVYINAPITHAEHTGTHQLIVEGHDLQYSGYRRILDIYYYHTVNHYQDFVVISLEV